ncbi:DUF1990 domain-containing protein [Corynebacterium alimapuense]|uniref:DUF1990 domain-containing protein n=1 Tax=Corynebacterium alimapuense TaxID=1576874 RepID=A0A3M8K8S1_9CORY|nr:DUF1990 domain-containing protein [Corynebacterium alimapuense]RNE49175.1 DUF1990 domain-containing protein [Corynebacterium alimapuense]
MSSLTYPDHLKLVTLGLAKGQAPSEFGLDDSWAITDHSAVLGHGTECFSAAATRLTDWRAHEHAGVKVSREGLLVRLTFGPTMSPCLILHEESTPDRHVLVYGTLPGHVECGEEAFIIDLADSGEVTGRCVAFSQHSWWLARLGSPVAHAVQKWATRRYVEGMRPK